MSSAKTETQARTAGSPQTEDLSGKQQLRGNYFDVESANTIAEKLYHLYHQKETGALEQNEMKAMISDAYGVFNRTYTPTIGDEQSFVEAHDQDRDGKVTLEDLKSICLSYLCKPLGAADNPTPKPSQPHQNLQNGQNKFLNSQHTFGEYNSSNANNSQREVVTANAYQSNQQNGSSVVVASNQQITKVQTQSLMLKSASNSQTHHSPFPSSSSVSQTFGLQTQPKFAAESTNPPNWGSSGIVIRSTSPQPANVPSNRLQMTSVNTAGASGTISGQIVSNMSQAVTYSGQVIRSSSPSPLGHQGLPSPPQTTPLTYQHVATPLNQSFGPSGHMSQTGHTAQHSANTSVPVSARGILPSDPSADPRRTSNSQNLARLEALKKDFETSKGRAELDRVLLQANTQYQAHKGHNECVEVTHIHPVLAQLYQLKYSKTPETNDMNEMTRGLVFNPSTGKIGQPELQIIYLKYMLGYVN